MNARRRGGLGPSNAAAAPRAFLLIAVAAVIGLVLLWKGLDSTPGTVAPAGAPVVAESSTDESRADQGSDTSADETSAAGGDTSSDQPATTEAPAPQPTHFHVLICASVEMMTFAPKVNDRISGPPTWGIPFGGFPIGDSPWGISHA